ncbi:MAG: 5-(carboxyamino)imidazole ribonucleotide synthase [Polyangiaceae bacterium]|nr:5-(carboxyamino)imidazole ribonucleotide synthase [Polyangiaceae bacterium]
MSRHLGILGGGQLGRMLALSARELGLEVTIIDPGKAPPAAAVAAHIHSEYGDQEALERIAQSDALTFEFENVPEQATRILEQKLPVAPPPRALKVSQDRLVEKNQLNQLGIETAAFCEIQSEADVLLALNELGPVLLKTRTLGYDGKGQALVRDASAAAAAFASLKGAAAIAEGLVPFDRELSSVATRARNGELAFYDLTENHHKAGILRRSFAPAPNISKSLIAQAQDITEKLLVELDYVGTLAIEFFQVGQRLIVNEFAPRVHNSGHWTIEGAETSQFENHVRAVMGFPLGSTEHLGHSVMINLIGSIPPAQDVLAFRGAHLHDYSKDPRPGRKVGHITIRRDSEEEARAVAAELEELIRSHEKGIQPSSET